MGYVHREDGKVDEVVGNSGEGLGARVEEAVAQKARDADEADDRGSRGAGGLVVARKGAHEFGRREEGLVGFACSHEGEKAFKKRGCGHVGALLPFASG